LSIIAAIVSGSIAIAGFLLSLRTTRFGTSETSKSEYRASDKITILGKVKSSQEESVILIHVLAPDEALARIDLSRFQMTALSDMNFRLAGRS
ncbi:MAG: hypothetical protein ACREBU_08380, partial [Nitrososphaera sp.]